MKYVVNVHFDGCIQFHVNADHEPEAQSKAEDMFAELSPEDIVRAICEVNAEDAIKED